MTRLLILLTVLAVARPAAAQTDPLVGGFLVTSNATVTLTSTQTASFATTWRGTLTIVPATNGGLLLTFAGEGVTCALTAFRSGANSLVFPAGQRCLQSDAAHQAQFTFALESGNCTTTGDRIALSFQWSITGTMQGQAVLGRASEVDAGSRM